MTALNRDALLKPLPVQREKVELPELSGYVWVHGMTTLEKSEFQLQFLTKNDALSRKRQSEIYPRLVVACARDDDGKRIFSDGDVANLGPQRGDIIDRIGDVAKRLSNIGDDESDAAEKKFAQANGNK